MLLVARQVLVFGMLGAAAGVAGAATATRVLAGLIFGLSSYDPVSFALVPALFVLTACVAAAIPARRALSVDPLVALRQN
jgi:ABC-type antimicrobial peptide transport system permease subunit